ncbi:tetratricopeptide repeat protein [Thermodesulfobacteriota bacterium]
MTSNNYHNKAMPKARLHYWVCLLLVITTLSVYWQVKDFEFVNFDDPLYVTDNRYVQKGLSLETIIWSFTGATQKTNYWVPLTWLSVLLDYQLYGLKAGGYHLTNVFFHILNTLLLFIVFKRLTGALWQSAFVAALFALHPLHVESVAWVTERKDVLSTFFWLLTMLSYYGYVRHPGVERYLLTLFLFVLGIMAKPMLVTLPFVLLLLDYWPLGRMQVGRLLLKPPPKSTVPELFWEKVPFFIIIGITGVATFLTQQAAGAVKSLALYPLDVRIANMLVSYVSYIGKMLWPVQLSFLYPHPGALQVWKTAGAFLLLVAISVPVIRAAKQYPYFLVGWLWYLGTLVPVIGLVVIGPHAMADRYTYVPLIGLFIMMAWGIPGFLPRRRFKKMVLFFTASVFLAIFMMMTWLQVRYWQNSITLLEHALDINADNVAAHINLGTALESNGRTTDAIRHYQAALRIDPDCVDAYNNLGVILESQGKTADAIRHFQAALRIDPNYAPAHNHLGNALSGQGKTVEATNHYLTAIQIDSEYKEAHYNLGNVLLAQGKFNDAINHYLEGLRIDPLYVEAYNNLGAALTKQGRAAEAIAHFQEALRIAPDYDDAYNNLKEILAVQEEMNKTVLKIKQAIAQNPKDAVAYYELGRIYKSRGELDKAAGYYQKALSIDPALFEALNNLAIIYAIQGKYNTARELFQKCIVFQPKQWEAYYYIAGTYARQNKIEESIKWLKQAIDKGFKDMDLLENDDNLKNIRETTYYKSLIRTP